MKFLDIPWILPEELSICPPRLFPKVSEQSNIRFITSLGILRWGSGPNVIRPERLSVLGAERRQRLRNPLRSPPPPRWTLTAGPFTTAGLPPLLVRFQIFCVCRRDGRKAQGYLWSNHYTISSPRRPHCIHLSVVSSPSLSLTLSLPFSLPLFTALFPHLSFIQSLSFSLYSGPHPDAL